MYQEKRADKVFSVLSGKTNSRMKMTGVFQCLKWENRLADEKTKALKYWKQYRRKAIKEECLGQTCR